MQSIALQHNTGDYTCMTNGLEDMYAEAARCEPPPGFLFCLGALCSPVYLKAARGEVPRMVYLNAAQPKRLYAFLAETVGFSCRVVEGRGFRFTLDAAKREIDAGNPVLAGACDMFHLPYMDKHYRKAHVPIHYFLIVGYDDDKRQVLLLDCGRERRQALSYDDLEQAWGAETKGFSRKNTMRAFGFQRPARGMRAVFEDGLRAKAEAFLRPRVGFAGARAYGKLAAELRGWEAELPPDAYRRSVAHLVEYCGFPPSPPEDASQAPQARQAARDRFAGLLDWGAREFGAPGLGDAAARFRASGELVGRLCALLMGCVKEGRPVGGDAASLVAGIAEAEREGFEAVELALA